MRPPCDVAGDPSPFKPWEGLLYGVGLLEGRMAMLLRLISSVRTPHVSEGREKRGREKREREMPST